VAEVAAACPRSSIIPTVSRAPASGSSTITKRLGIGCVNNKRFSIFARREHSDSTLSLSLSLSLSPSLSMSDNPNPEILSLMGQDTYETAAHDLRDWRRSYSPPPPSPTQWAEHVEEMKAYVGDGGCRERRVSFAPEPELEHVWCYVPTDRTDFALGLPSSSECCVSPSPTVLPVSVCTVEQKEASVKYDGAMPGDYCDGVFFFEFDLIDSRAPRPRTPG
jgi:hypothetical protein